MSPEEKAKEVYGLFKGCANRGDMIDVLAQALRDARRGAIEEAAKVFDAVYCQCGSSDCCANSSLDCANEAIRSLKNKESP